MYNSCNKVQFLQISGISSFMDAFWKKRGAENNKRGRSVRSKMVSPVRIKERRNRILELKSDKEEVKKEMGTEMKMILEK